MTTFKEAFAALEAARVAAEREAEAGVAAYFAAHPELVRPAARRPDDTSDDPGWGYGSPKGLGGLRNW